MSVVVVALWCAFAAALTTSKATAGDSVYISSFFPKPLLRSSHNVTVLQNKDVRLYLKCVAEYPTEWVHIWEDVLSPQLRAANKSYSTTKGYFVNDYHFIPATVGQSTQRKEIIEWMRYPDQNGTFNAILELKYQVVATIKDFVCRAVSDHANNQVLKLDPSVTAGEVHLTTQKCDHTSECGQAHEGRNEDFNECPIVFRIARTPSGYYWHCEGHGEAALRWGFWGVIAFHTCPTSSYCANTYRRFRVASSCVRWVTGLTTGQISHDQRWAAMPEDGAGVVSCVKYITEIQKADSESREEMPPVEIAGAVEYFFPRNINGASPPPLQTSVHETALRDLIWFEPDVQSGTIYYTRERIEVICFVSKYVFADYRRLQIILNGSESIIDYEKDSNGDGVPSFEESSQERFRIDAWASKKFDLHFEEYGTGQYLLDCRAHVWNTTQIVIQTRNITVRNVEPPTFEAPFENVTWTEGDTKRRLHCDVEGDPEPRVEWEHDSLPAARPEGRRQLVLHQVSADQHGEFSITCIATNKFGDTATKVFHIQVERSRFKAHKDSAAPISTTGVILLVVGLLAIILGLGVGLLFLYIRFVKFGRAVANFLTDEEIKLFLEGRRQTTISLASAAENAQENLVPTRRDDGGGHKQEDEDCLEIFVDSLPYNLDYEIQKPNICVDFKNILGSGHYGIVFQGRINFGSDFGSESIHVAVKTVRPNVPIEYFKALLSELKILAYIGTHENIAKLIGAYTAEIKNRVLYVGVELCKCSLLQHLRSMGALECGKARDLEEEVNGAAPGYVSPAGHMLESLTPAHEYQNQERGIQTFGELVRWANEIGAGMEFLAQKKVIHGDLAARNVLLSSDLRSKICDFGLARQLVDHSYIKSQSCDLPWKWMAIESLSSMNFSTKSDVWAFGVTCWEIFSLGKVPYPVTAWTRDFVDQLQAGMRLTRPEYASAQIYTEMLECWQQKPTERPTFSQLVHFFSELSKNQSTISAPQAYANVIM